MRDAQIREAIAALEHRATTQRRDLSGQVAALQAEHRSGWRLLMAGVLVRRLLMHRAGLPALGGMGGVMLLPVAWRVLRRIAGRVSNRGAASPGAVGARR